MDRLKFQAGNEVGHFRALFQTGLTASIAANGCIFSASLQSLVPTRALITALQVGASLVTPFTAAQEIGALAYIARNFSGPDSGGNAQTLSGSPPPQSLNSLADTNSAMTIRVASTTALTVGARTLDPNPFTGLILAQPAASGNTSVPVNQVAGYQVQSDQQFGINLQGAYNPANTAVASGTQEGIVVNIPVAQGAGGSVRYQIYMEWIEYSYGPGPVAGYIG